SARTNSTSCSARSTACFILGASRPFSAPSRKSLPRPCCRNFTVPTSTWCAPRATSLSCRADATWNAPITCTIITDMFHYEFMNNALAAAGIVAVVSGIVGYFLVMRGQTFAGHALSHIGFAGATGAGLIGLAPIWGLLGFTVAAGIIMGALSDRISNRDIAIGIVLALALGFGLLFLHYYTSFATQATALLFGNVLAVDR